MQKKKNSNLEKEDLQAREREGQRVKVQSETSGPRHRAIELYATSQGMSG